MQLENKSFNTDIHSLLCEVLHIPVQTLVILQGSAALLTKSHGI